MISEHRWPHLDPRRIATAQDSDSWRFVPWLDTLRPVAAETLRIRGEALRAKITARLKAKVFPA